MRRRGFICAIDGVRELFAPLARRRQAGYAGMQSRGRGINRRGKLPWENRGRAVGFSSATWRCASICVRIRQYHVINVVVTDADTQA